MQHTPSLTSADSFPTISSCDDPVDIILKNFATNIINSDDYLWVDVVRDDVWCICLGFYKLALKHQERLAKNLCKVYWFW